MRCTLAVLLAATIAGCVTTEPNVESSSQELIVLPPICTPTFTYYVNANAPAGGTGSSAAPFRRINDALTAAKSGNQCAADVYIYAGTYSENLWLNRATTLRGASRWSVLLRGYIYNPTAGKLRIERMTIDDSWWFGVYASGGRTELDQVTVRNTTYGGVYQYGGSLDLKSVSIYDMKRSGTSSLAPALTINGGSDANLYNVYLARTGQALRIAGGSTVHANYLRAYYINAYDYAAGHCSQPNGAIDIVGASELTAFNVTLYGITGIGVYASSGGTAALNNATLRNFGSTACGLDRSAALYADSDGYLIASDFVIGAGGCGVFVRSTQDAGMYLTRGTINDELDAAVCWDNGPFDEITFLSNVEFDSNAHDFARVIGLGSSSLPAPTPVCVTMDCD